MTRQQQITKEQVRHMRDAAERRANDAVERAMHATSRAEYRKAVDEGSKAAYDYDVWCKVLASL